MNFANVMKEESTKTYTENGARAYNTTEDALLDLFSIGGALRTRSEDEIVQKFRAAYKEDALLATKMMFYIGNVRGGLGERRTFRICLKWLANNHSGVALKNLPYIALFNRWDSVFELIGTPIEPSMWKLISDTLIKDANALAESYKNNAPPQISLLAKWLPSENASSKKTRILAREVISNLDISPKLYRKTLSALRRALKVVERDMSSNNWSNIYYSGVPSYAMKNYRNAFKAHDPERFNDFIGQVNRGEKKIHSDTLYPYNLVEAYGGNGYSWTLKPYDEVIEAQWKALPNYVEDGANVVVMADVSGSMCGRPMATSIGLATYFALKNQGQYHNLFMTFSEKPSFVSLNDCETLRDAITKVSRANWNMNTNLNLAMKTILNLAIKNNIPQNEMPKALCVITDMEIDSYGGHHWDYSVHLRQMFEKAGYKMPKLVFWNVESRHDTFLTKDPHTILVSGQSTSTFKTVLRNLTKNAYETMLDTLNNPIYDCITI